MALYSLTVADVLLIIYSLTRSESGLYNINVSTHQSTTMQFNPSDASVDIITSQCDWLGSNVGHVCESLKIFVYVIVC